MPGLPRSWTDFQTYESCNISATQRLLEAALRQPRVPQFVHASTSSVYGRNAAGDESLALRPVSPYGVTKLAAENLCRAYAEERGLPLVILRYFSVYGPRQRPDMGYHQFIESLLCGWPIRVFGDGRQVRGNTYVDDCVAATILAMNASPGEIFNVGGDQSITVIDVIRKLEKLTGCRAAIEYQPPRAGDQQTSRADTNKLERELGWRPQVRIDDGLARQLDWQRSYVLPIAA
jgi:nucleoside-diphosphate-sugar epimerase